MPIGVIVISYTGHSLVSVGCLCPTYYVSIDWPKGSWPVLLVHEEPKSRCCNTKFTRVDILYSGFVKKRCAGVSKYSLNVLCKSYYLQTLVAIFVSTVPTFSCTLGDFSLYKTLLLVLPPKHSILCVCLRLCVIVSVCLSVSVCLFNNDLLYSRK